MKLEVMNPDDLTLGYVTKHQYSLYYIMWTDNPIVPYKLVSFAKEGLATPTDDYILVKLTRTGEEDTDVVHEVSPEVEHAIEEDWRRKPRSPRRSYKLDSWDSHKLIEVESRTDGSIRVNFKDKDSAEEYYEYLREFFYKGFQNADYLSVSTIYKELKVVNWKAEDCDDWVWATLDHGTCRYISESVLKTKNKNMWGFTLQAPQHIDYYGTRV